MKNILSILALFSLGFGLYSCGKPKHLEYVDFENVRFQKASLSQSVVAADVKYYNPNSYGLKLKSADLDIFVNDNLVGNSRLDTLIRIPARDTFTIPLVLNLKLSDLMKNAMQFLLNPDVKIRVQGKARVGKGGFYMNMPVNYEGKQRMDWLLKDSTLRNIIGQ